LSVTNKNELSTDIKVSPFILADRYPQFHHRIICPYRISCAFFRTLDTWGCRSSRI